MLSTGTDLWAVLVDGGIIGLYEELWLADQKIEQMVECYPAAQVELVRVRVEHTTVVQEAKQPADDDSAL